jgi:autotransporter-associated beta strand protein
MKTTERIAYSQRVSAMRTKATPMAVIRLIQFLAVLWCSVVTTSALDLTWIGPTFGDLGYASNWDPNVLPNPDDPNNTTAGAGDRIIFNGNTPGVLTNVCQTPNFTGASGSTVGFYVLLTSNQTSSVTWVSTNGIGGTIRLQSITNSAGSGGLTIGDNGSGNTFNTIWGGINGQVHQLRNDSTNPCTINSGMEIRLGGGGIHNFTFDGSGDWNVTNDLNNSLAPSVSLIIKNGGGTMIWYSTNNPNLQNNSTFGTSNAVFLNGGKLILKTSDSFRSVNIGPRGIVDNAFLEYDDINPAAGGTLSGNITGSGALQVNSGTLTLSGQNTYSGSNILSGGELIANSPESAGIFGPLGIGSTISLIGGTLGYGPNNAFDYSSRFDTAANQKYNIDTGGQFVFYATSLASSGGLLNKIGPGALTLTGGASYSGPTTVTGGKLVFQGPMTGTGNITIADGAVLGVFANGTQVSPGTLTLGSGTILEFNNVNSVTTAPLAAGTLASAGNQTININSGTFIVGESFPLLSWSSGSAPAVILGAVNGATGTLSTNGNTIQFNVTSLPRVWTGASNGNWDTTTSGNWTTGGIPPTTIWQNGNAALFDDTATGTTNVTVNSPVTPSSTTVNNSNLTYTIASSGANNIGGTGGLLKSGSNTLTLSGGANTYTGVTTMNGGVLSVSQLANGSSASDIGAANSSAGNLVLDGGTLQYSGNTASINRLFTLGAFGGTIDNEGTGTLTLNNAGTIAMTGSGARMLTLTGVNANGDTLASALHDGSGATSLLKQGAGTWILTGTNAYSGGTTISNGTLQVGNGGATGAIGSGGCVDNDTLVFNRSGTVTVFGPITGNGTLTQNGTGTVILANDNSYTGGTTINSGTLQLGNGGPTGSLYEFGPIVDNGTLIFNSTGTQTYETYSITGTGNVIVRTGKVRALGSFFISPYTGWTEIDAGAIFQPTMGQDGYLLSSVVTNNGTMLFERQDSGVFGYAGNIFGTGKVMEDNNNQNTGNSTLTGTNFSTGGLVIAGGYLILGDNMNPFFGAMAPIGDIVFTNAVVNDGNSRGLILNRPDDFTLSNNIVGKTVITGFGQGNLGALILMGTGTVTLIGATNTGQGGTVISNGALVVGRGGATGSLGTGPITDLTSLTFNRSGTLNVPCNFAGPGTVAMVGSGVVNLTGLYSGLAGSTAISNGVLGANSIGGDVDVVGGTLAVGGYQTVGTLAIGNSTVSPAVAANLNISAGVVSMALNTALAPQSNSFVQMTVTNTLVTLTFNGTGYTTNTTVTSATGAIRYTNGLLNLVNVGPTLQPGQRFVLFSQPVAIPIGSTPGFTVINNLATDGSVTVQTVATPPVPKITKVTSGSGFVTIAATNNFGPGGSWELLATNDITAPLTNWPVVTNNYFDANGKLTVTTPESTNQQFFILRAP